ncbi:hypothetical protein RYX36_027966, partial [Vicia faba]
QEGSHEIQLVDFSNTGDMFYYICSILQDGDSLLSIAISALALPGVFCLSVTNGRIVTHPQGRFLTSQ